LRAVPPSASHKLSLPQFQHSFFYSVSICSSFCVHPSLSRFLRPGQWLEHPSSFPSLISCMFLSPPPTSPGVFFLRLAPLSAPPDHRLSACSTSAPRFFSTTVFSCPPSSEFWELVSRPPPLSSPWSPFTFLVHHGP